MIPPRFTGKDRETVKAMRSQGCTLREIGAALDPPRTKMQVSNFIARNSRHIPRKFVKDRGRRGRVAELHARGLCDRLIAAALGCCQSLVARYRHEHEPRLPPNPDPEKARPEYHARRNAGWLSDYGCTTLGQLKRQRNKLRAVRRGWPAGTTLAQARRLEVIEAAGRPLTGAEICRSLGLKYDPSNGNGTKDLRQMRREGVLVRVGRSPVPGCHGALWDLSPATRQYRSEWLALNTPSEDD